MWLVPRFLLSWSRDIFPHVVLHEDLLEQLLVFCGDEHRVIPSLAGCVGVDGAVCYSYL